MKTSVCLVFVGHAAVNVGEGFTLEKIMLPYVLLALHVSAFNVNLETLWNFGRFPNMNFSFQSN